MGFRFQKRLTILPGVRINLSKGGVSASLGPRGADVNVGRDGVTANGGIPGTGLSYRRKIGGGFGGLGLLAIIAGLGVWAFQHRTMIASVLAPATATVAPGTAPTTTNLRFVHRNDALLRASQSESAAILKRENKGARVTLLATDGDWSEVQDGTVTGWMRNGTLGTAPPR
jgi:hypothetical protein